MEGWSRWEWQKELAELRGRTGREVLHDRAKRGGGKMEGPVQLKRGRSFDVLHDRVEGQVRRGADMRGPVRLNGGAIVARSYKNEQRGGRWGALCDGSEGRSLRGPGRQKQRAR